MNITCPRCRHRHPADRTCAESARLADQARITRFKMEQQQISNDKAHAIWEYETALENVDSILGAGIAVRIVTLWEAWRKLCEMNKR